MTIPSKVNIERYVLLEEQLRINNIHNGPSLYINQTSNENVVDIQQNNNSFFYIENDGNVGIGTNNPNSRLHVNGIITGNGSQITNLNYDNITNQPVIDNVSDSNFDLKLSNKTTTNLIEGSNLYYTDERVEQHILSKNLISLTNCNLNNNELLYYTGESWCNLKIDETTLEITTDNKLKVIGGTSSGGGGGTQVLIQNESDTITSNLEKPIIDSSNFVTDGLIAHYKFDDDLDNAVGTNELSINPANTSGNITYINDGLFEEALDLDTFKYVLDSQSVLNAYNSGYFSVSLWFKIYGTISPNVMILSKYEESTYRGSARAGLNIFVKNTNIVEVNRLNSSASWQINQSTTISSNTWFYLTVVCDGNDTRLYVNSIHQETETSASGWNTISSTTSTGSTDYRWGIGTYLYDGDINSHSASMDDTPEYYLDDFRIYDRALSAAEIEKLYNAPYITKSLITDSTDEVVSFKYNPDTAVSGQTEYTINFPQETECDILIVGGGGGGGRRHGTGGGAGTLIYHKGIACNGTYSIKVGNGGAGMIGNVGATAASGTANLVPAQNGHSSQFQKIDGTQQYKAVGGGRGQGWGTGSTWDAQTNGGTGPYVPSPVPTLSTNNIFNSTSVSVTNNLYVNSLTSPEGIHSHVGGSQIDNFKGGGGGGAGSAGMNHGEENTIYDGYGGDGLSIDITGVNVIYAGGGNGSDISGSVSQVYDSSKPTIQSRGGGGYGSDSGIPEDGLDGTGGGGGGQGNDYYDGGTGGSGIVIIRYKTQTVTTVTRSDPKLSSLSSLTPELNSLLYFNTSNTINYLELDPTTLEITSNNQLSVIGGSTSSGVDGIDGTSTTILEISKHIIPDTNATYDIGSAEKKIRHLFLSDNSLWIGDDNKFSISEGKMRIKKRKRNIIPSKLLELEPTINETKILNLSEKQSLNDLNLGDWEKYVKENYPELNLFGSDLFQNKDDYELNATTDAWIETTDKNILISDYYSNIGIGEIEPKYKLDVKGDINLTGKLYKNGIDYDSNIILFEKQNLSNNDILYYNNGNWSNLKLDENSLEISNDNKLKLIDTLLNRITELENRISVLENP